MIDIMIVDDDVLVLEGLSRTIDWEALSCRLVAQCIDVTDAVNAFEKHRPQIVITDICMPDENGFKLIEQLRELDADIQFIILTGYADFEYAKSAIDKNVCAFLLKPTDTDEVIDAVKKAAAHIHSSKKSKKHLEGDALAAVLEGSREADDFLEHDMKSLPVLKNNYVVAVLSIDNFKKLHSAKAAADALMMVMERNISLHKDYVMECRIGADTWAMVIFLRGGSYQSFLDLLRPIQLQFSQTAVGTVTIGISGIYRKFNMVRRAYQAAQAAVGQRAFLGSGKIIEYTMLSEGNQIPPQLSMEESREIVWHIKKLDRDAALGMINRYFDQIGKMDRIDHIEDIKSCIEELAILIIHECVKNQQELEHIFGRMIKPVIEIEEMEYISDIRQWTEDLVTKITQTPQIMIAGYNKPLVRDTIFYIMRHYSEPLTIDLVAEQLYVSVRQLSRQFKSETGKTFTEYLTSYRMEMAMELLRNETERVNEIGKKVGYNSLKYFCKLFKEHTGVTPAEYRSNQL